MTQLTGLCLGSDYYKDPSLSETPTCPPEAHLCSGRSISVAKSKKILSGFGI